MSEGKNSTIFYTEWLPLVASLANASKIKFYDIVLNPEKRDTEINDDPHLKGIVDFVLLKIRENETKYEKVKEIRKLAGSKGGLANARFAKQKKQKEANQAVNVNDNVNVNAKEERKRSLNEEIYWQGKVILLTKSDYEQWKKSFSFIDLPSQLQALDDFYNSTDDKKNWFVRTSSTLAKKNTEAQKEQRVVTINPNIGKLTEEQRRALYE
jgi:hypothetical protein